MKKKPAISYSFLAIMVSFLLIAGSAYSHYDELMEIDLLSSHLSFENPDLEGLLADKPNKVIIFVQSSFVLFCFSSLLRVEPLPLFSSPVPSSDGAISILRC